MKYFIGYNRRDDCTLEIIITDYVLPNGRKLSGTEEEVLEVLNEERERIDKELAELTLITDKQDNEYRKKHRKLWNY